MKTTVSIALILIALAILLSGLWLYFGGRQSAGLVANPTGTVSAYVAATLDISIVQSTVNFSTVGVGSTFVTNGNYSNASYFLVRNDGSVLADVKINAAYLWNSTCTYTKNYELNVTNATGNYSVNDSCVGSSVGGKNKWDDMPIGSPKSGCSYAGNDGSQFIQGFNYTDNSDYARVDIRITVPKGEPAGTHSSTVTFTATQSGSFSVCP